MSGGSLIKVACPECGKHSVHRPSRIRMTQQVVLDGKPSGSDSYIFCCPTCRELRSKPMNETARGMLLLGGVYPPVELPALLAFVTLMQDRDDLAAAVLQEVAA